MLGVEPCTGRYLVLEPFPLVNVGHESADGDNGKTETSPFEDLLFILTPDDFQVDKVFELAEDFRFFVE